MSKHIVVDGVDYAPVITGNRHVVVIDRGWIYAGDLTESNGRIKLSNAVWVFRWESIGFDGVLSNPKDSRVTIKGVPYPVDLPEGAELFRIPVPAGWGL